MDFYLRAEKAPKRLPGVTAMGLSDSLPPDRWHDGMRLPDLVVAGRPPTPAGERGSAVRAARTDATLHEAGVDMRASAIEFRLRMAINAAIIILGFWAPWIEAWGVGRRITLLEWLALELGRTGLVSFTIAAPAVIVVGALFAAAGAMLRVWGTAYLGAGTVNSLEMKAGGVMADGPYRYVRNPLYLGLWCMVAAIALIMPASGSIFAMVFITVFLLRLIFGEEAFLATQIGEPYKLYRRAVPRLLPRPRTPLPRGESQPHWLRAMLAELTPIGVFVALAFLSWSYDSRLMGRTILIFFGVSLVVRALLPEGAKPAGAE
jgi:protein-S-isoprenylcysteine O-methyltransferase Ste14